MSIGRPRVCPQEGLASAMETMCGQAYGAEQHRQLGIILQRVQLILLLCCLPIAAVFLNTEKILLFAGQVTPVDPSSCPATSPGVPKGIPQVSDSDTSAPSPRPSGPCHFLCCPRVRHLSPARPPGSRALHAPGQIHAGPGGDGEGGEQYIIVGF